jgi:hypothetical protein
VDHLGKYKVSNISPLTPLIPKLHVDSWLVTSFSSMYISRNKFITKELSLVTVRWPRNCNTVFWNVTSLHYVLVNLRQVLKAALVSSLVFLYRCT